MFLSTNRSRAQANISCDVDVCKNPAKQFCNSCQVKLCVKCVPKHVDELSSMSHDIVHFRNRKAQLVFTECELHKGQRCVIQCQQCQTPICYKCCIGPHKHHNAVDITDLAGIKKEEIQREVDEIENEIIPHCKETCTYLQNDLTKITKEIDQVKQEKELLRNTWHQEVDYFFDHLDSLLDEAKFKNSETLRKYQIKIQKNIQDMTQTLQRNKDILKTKNASDIVDFNSKQDEFRGIDTRIEFKKPILKATTFKGEKLSISVGQIEATLTFLQWSRPSTDASDRANQRVKFRPIQQMVPMNRLRGDEVVIPFERRIYDSPSPPSEFGFPIDDSWYTSD